MGRPPYPTPIPFPSVYVAASVVLALVGLWLLLRKWRRPVGVGPHCHSCDYLLIGITSERCPECGTVVDPRAVSVRVRRRRFGSVLAGIILIGVAAAISCAPVRRWSASVYWYQYRPTILVMGDLKRGNGLPPPKRNPVEERYVFGHGWVSERIDLARVALDELQRRDRNGTLPAKYRREMDQMALADLANPIAAPAPYHLRNDLGDRLIAGRLTVETQAALYARAATFSLSTDPKVLLWNDVPVRLRSQVLLPTATDEGFVVATTFTGVAIDGHKVRWNKPVLWWYPEASYWQSSGNDSTFTRYIASPRPGKHRLDITFNVEVRHGDRGSPERGPVLHSEQRALSTEFEVAPPTWAVNVLRLVRDPVAEFWHHASAPLLNRLARRATAPPSARWLAADELIRRARRGDLTQPEIAEVVDSLLDLQRDPSVSWDGDFGDFIESLAAAKTLGGERRHTYEAQHWLLSTRGPETIRQGEALPFELVMCAWRGNSRNGGLVAASWGLEISFDGEVEEPLELECLEQVHEVNFSKSEDAVPYVVRFPHIRPGTYVMRTKVKGVQMWSEHRLTSERAAESEAGELRFTVLSPPAKPAK